MYTRKLFFNTKHYKNNIDLINKYSSDPTIHQDLNDKTFDIVFIDGDHSYDNVKNDIEIALKYTRPNGFIMLHDYWINAKQDFRLRGVVDAVHQCLMYKYKFLYLLRSVIVFENNNDFSIYE